MKFQIEIEIDLPVVVRVNPIDQFLSPLLVVLREGCMDLFNREKTIVVRVSNVFKELLPFGLLRTSQPFLNLSALCTDVVVAEEAVEPVVAVVGLGEDLAAGGASLAVPGTLPVNEAHYLFMVLSRNKSSYIAGQSLSF